MILPRIISISGLDGTGKTTLALSLKKHIQDKGLSVTICHIGASLPGPSEIQHPISKHLAILIFLKDYFQIFFQYIRNIGSHDVLIFDRFIYDTLVKCAYKQNTAHISKFIRFPLSHIAFLLLLPNTVSIKRDKTHSREYHVNKELLYNDLLNAFSIIPIDATQSTKSVLERVKRYV